MSIDPAEKMITGDRIEKYILRKAFDTSDDPNAAPYLPSKILWRQKEQFSDGVGYGWIDALKGQAQAHVSDADMKDPKPEWGEDIPDSKEASVGRASWSRMQLANVCIDTGTGACSTSYFHNLARRRSNVGRLPGRNKPIPADGECSFVRAREI